MRDGSTRSKRTERTFSDVRRGGDVSRPRSLALARHGTLGSTTEATATPDDVLPTAASTSRTPPHPAALGRARLAGEEDADTEDMAAEEARQIIARSRAAYAACATYADEGTIDTAFRGKHQFLNQVVFRTAFAGPNAVRSCHEPLGM